MTLKWAIHLWIYVLFTYSSTSQKPQSSQLLHPGRSLRGEITPAAASLDSLDSTVAPTLTSVRRDHLQHAHIVTKASPSVIIGELSEPYCNNLGQTFHMTLESPIQSSTAFSYRKQTAAKYSLQHYCGMCIVL